MKSKYLVLAIVLVLAATIMIMAANPAEAKNSRALKECNDGMDNDGDGAVDLADAGCENRGDNDESNCGDGVCEGDENSVTCPEDCGMPDSCSDTDYGFNVMTEGTVSGYDNGDEYSYTDFCLPESTVLQEYYCNGDTAEYTTFDCAWNFTGCSNGACI